MSAPSDKSVVEALNELRAAMTPDPNLAVAVLLQQILEVQQACLVELRRLKK